MRTTTALALALFLSITGIAAAQEGGSTRVADAVWADGILYDTVLTPTSFLAPPEHSTDVLYNFMMSGLAGQRSISEAAPGDRDYNGGRWSVRMVVFTEEGTSIHDPDGDGTVDFELVSEEELLEHQDLGHVEIFETTTYFECPLLPRRGR